MRIHAGFVALALTLGAFGASPSRAGESGDHDALLRALPKSRLTLLDGIRQAEKSGESALSAKFELDGKGRFLLSVYTAEKGLGKDAEHNVLKELLGPPTGEAWTPEVEVFEDVPHVARSAQQHALMALSSYTLADAIAWAEADAPGTVFSAIPILRDRRPLFRVLVAKGEEVRELVYDMRTGKGRSGDVREATPVVLKVESHATRKEGPWTVEFGCCSAEEVFLRVEGGVPARLVLVGRDGATIAASWKGKGEFAETKIPEGFGPVTELRIYPAAR